MRYRHFNFLIVGSLLLIGAALVTAQDAATPTVTPLPGIDGQPVVEPACAAPLQAVWMTASDTCLGGPDGYICNGGSAPQAEPVGAVSNALAAQGALVDVTQVSMLHTPGIDPNIGLVGVAWLRLADPPISGVLFGEVRIRNVTPPDFPAWKSMTVETASVPSPCEAAPRSAFVIQSHFGQTARLVINGTSLAMAGTVMIYTYDDGSAASTTFVGLAGQSTLLAFGTDQPLRTGQAISVPYAPGNISAPAGPPGVAQPLDTQMTHNLPMPLLDAPVMLPQPGYVTTQGTVNLRAAPDIYSALLLEVPAGEELSILGRNAAGDWYNVRLNNGVSGWMFAELLFGNPGVIEAVYEATPAPPQRYGELGYLARVEAPSGVVMRSAPDANFPAVVTLPEGTHAVLLNRSPYSPWVKIDANGAVGWVPLISLDTRSIIEALPIDFDVPPPPATPTPTTVPGSFGNAFPDPRGGY
jgi:uncharacterized protein YraI